MKCLWFIIFKVLTINNVFSLQSDERYNLGILAIPPGEAREVLQQSTGHPAQHSDYTVWNLGKENVWTELKYGTLVEWYGWVVGYGVAPGEKKLVPNLDGRYYVTALRILNSGKERAIIRARKNSGMPQTVHKESSFEIDFDINDFAKFYVATVADNIPVIGATLSHIIEFFWPDTEEDVWEKIKGKVEKMVDSKIADAIESILDANLRKLKKKVRALARSLNNGIKGENITDHYMNVAQDLIGVEEGFRFSRKNNLDYHKMNYVVLPLYSSIITMKLLFYRMATVERENLGITDAKLNQIRLYTRELMLDGAFEHISAVMEERLHNAYETAHPENMFNALVTVWTYCGINGLESLSLWENLVNHPESNKTVYSDTVTYSTYMGRPTIALAKQVTAGNMDAELLPELVYKTLDGRRMQVRETLEAVIVHYNDDYVYAIATYYSRTGFHMGGTGPSRKTIDFKGRYLKKIVAYGDNILRGIKLHLSDQTIFRFGNVKDSKQTVFELQGHHIAGIFASDGSEFGEKQLVNIAVSYMLDNKYMI